MIPTLRCFEVRLYQIRFRSVLPILRLLICIFAESRDREEHTAAFRMRACARQFLRVVKFIDNAQQQRAFLFDVRGKQNALGIPQDGRRSPRV